MTDIAYVRQNEIDAHLQALDSERASERRKAALFMGEAAVADAVPKLVELYESDPDTGVRQAAGYALGMFKAVEDALKKGQEDRVVGLLRAVEEDYKLGRRANRTGFIRTLIALALTLIALIALIAVLPEGLLLGVPGLAQPSRTRADIIAELRPTLNNVRNDTNTLQAEFQKILGGGTLDCTAFFNNPQPYALAAENAAAYPELAGVVTGLTTAQTTLTAAYIRYDSACFGDQPLPASQVGQIYPTLVESLQDFPALDAALDASLLAAQPPTVIPTEIPTASLVPVEIPAASPEPSVENVQPTLVQSGTVDVTAVTTVQAIPEPETATPAVTVDVQVDAARLLNIVDSVQRLNGPMTQLTQNWEDVQSAGRTDSCQRPPPAIPEDYSLPAEIASGSPEMAQAAGLLNDALADLRVAWADFFSACSGDITLLEDSGLARAGQLNAQFNTAKTIINRVLGR